MKSWKIILAFVLVFSLLFASYYFIEMYEPKRQPSHETKLSQITLLNLNVEEINKLNIKNEEQTFALYREENIWRVENNPSAVLSLSKVDALCFSAANLSAISLVEENAADISVYGLDAPQGVVTLLKENGERNAFSVGNLTPTGDGYYCILENEQNVYLLPQSVGALFLSSLTAFRDMTVVSVDMNAIQSVTIQKGGIPLHLEQKEKTADAHAGAVSTWKIVSPIERDADDVLVREKILTPISQIVAPSVVADTLADIESFGFSGDYLEIKTNVDVIRICFGTAFDKYYLYIDGKETVYEFGLESLPFLDIEAFDVLEKMTNLISVDTISSVDIDLQGTKATLSVSKKGDKLTCFLNDTEVPEKDFKDFYLELAALSVDGVVEKPVDSSVLKPAARIVYMLTDNSTITLEYYPYDSFHYAVFENSENSFYIKKTKLTDLAQKLNMFMQNTKL